MVAFAHGVNCFLFFNGPSLTLARVVALLVCALGHLRAHACLLARAGSRAAHHRHQLFRLVRATTGIVISARDEAVDWSHRAPRGCRPCTCSAAGRCRTRKERACETFRACRRRSWTARRRSIAMPRGGCAQRRARSRSRTIEPLLARHGTTALSVVIDVWSQARPTHRTALPIGKKSHCSARVTLAPSSAVHVRADRLQLGRSEWRRPTRTPRAAACRHCSPHERNEVRRAIAAGR